MFTGYILFHGYMYVYRLTGGSRLSLFRSGQWAVVARIAPKDGFTDGLATVTKARKETRE